MEGKSTTPIIGKHQNFSHGITDTLAEAICDASRVGDVELLQNYLKPIHAADMAEFISKLPSDERKKLVGQLGKTFDPEILVELGMEIREEILDVLGYEESATALTKLETDDAVSIIEDLDEEGQKELLHGVPEDIREELKEGLSHPEDSAGRLMQKKMVAVPEFWTVGQVIDFLRSEDGDIPDDFYEIFVVDPKFHPVGTLLLSRIIRQQRDVVISTIMETHFQIVETHTDQEEVGYLFRKYGLASAPVVNHTGRLVGLIAVDDVVDVIGEEAEEDIMHMGGVSETDINAGINLTTKRRFPWLVVNIITAIAASLVIGLFEGAIDSIVALAVLMPIIASISANAGTQTATVAVRAIATKELTAANAMRVIRKEIVVGSINGVVFGLLTAFTVWWRYDDIQLSIVFAIAMFIAMVLAGLSGAIIPLGLVKMRIDPAVASGVFLTTITDIVSFAAFLGLASLILI